MVVAVRHAAGMVLIGMVRVTCAAMSSFAATEAPAYITDSSAREHVGTWSVPPSSAP